MRRLFAGFLLSILEYLPPLINQVPVFLNPPNASGNLTLPFNGTDLSPHNLTISFNGTDFNPLNITTPSNGTDLNSPNLTTPSDDINFDPCNRTDSVLSCPYKGVCSFPASCIGGSPCPAANCRRNCVDWGNGVYMALCTYAATLQNGTKAPNPWACETRASIYDRACTSGLVCQRKWTRAPPICSPPYPSCTDGAACEDGQKCVTDPRNWLAPQNKICVDASKTCGGDSGGGDAGRAECGIDSACLSGACVKFIDCAATVYGCPENGFDYGEL